MSGPHGPRAGATEPVAHVGPRRRARLRRSATPRTVVASPALGEAVSAAIGLQSVARSGSPKPIWRRPAPPPSATATAGRGGRSAVPPATAAPRVGGLVPVASPCRKGRRGGQRCCPLLSLARHVGEPQRGKGAAKDGGTRAALLFEVAHRRGRSVGRGPGNRSVTFRGAPAAPEAKPRAGEARGWVKAGTVCQNTMQM